MTNLDYSGIPEQDFRRELRDRLGLLAKDTTILSEPVAEDEATGVFNSIARTVIKGDKLKTAIANMNPAGFIPVEEGASITAALARRGEKTDRITFGLYKTACDFINGRSTSLDEAFLINMNILDPARASTEVVSRHRGITDSSSDWLSEFLIKLSPLAGLMIAGYLNDLAMSRFGKAPTPDGPNSGMQPTSYHMQGMPAGIALLIEAGVTLVGMAILMEPSNDSPEANAVAEMYSELEHDSNRRQVILEEAGYDYEALKKNKSYDDYMAIKQYALEYISHQVTSIQFDHWIAYANVADNQSFLNSTLAMAPMYSRRWRAYHITENESVLKLDYEIEDPEILEELEAAVASGLNRGLRDLFGSLLSVSNDHYNKTLQVYSMQIDERLLCCILWFVGPLDLEFLKKISNILHVLGARVTVNWKSLLSALGEGTARAVANMIMSYIGMLIEKVFNDVLKSMFKIPGNDWSVALKKCLGLDILFKLLESAWLLIFKEVQKLLNKLKSMIADLKSKSDFSIEIVAERRWLITLSGLIRAVVDRLEQAQDVCDIKPDENEDPEAANERAAEAAVEFVMIHLDNSNYPVIDVPEDVRRKFFRNVPAFETKLLKLPVPGLNQAGQSEVLSTADKVSECGENGRALEGIAIGKKIADIINS